MYITIRQGFARIMNYFAENPWIAYLSIALLQIKVMLWIWKYRDLAPGDTSYYFLGIFSWLDKGRSSIVRSPAYTLVMAGLQSIVNDPFWVLVIAQTVMALCASLLILALFRRLLPKHIAWIIAAWWALLPTNFDTAYNVHLFSALFPLALFVVAAYADNIYGRGVVLGGLLFTALLVRNEYCELFVVWFIFVLGYEIYKYKQKNINQSIRQYLIAYGLPFMVVTLIVTGFLLHAKPGGFPGIEMRFEKKITENMCETYAYDRKQQGDPWPGNPWTDCQKIIERDFDRPSVSFFQAIFLNPSPIFENLWWNAKLIPSGTQLALFNYFSGGPDPDYMRAKHSHLVWIPFWFVVGLNLIALLKYFFVPSLKRGKPAIQNGFAWLLMASAAFMVVGIMLMQRPRPAYMYPYTIFIMALTGLGVHQLFEMTRVSEYIKMLLPLVGILLIILVPSYYNHNYRNFYGYKGQPLRKTYERIVPYLKKKYATSPIIVTPRGDESLCNYLDKPACKVVKFSKIAGPYLGYYLNMLGVNWIYLDSSIGPLPREYNAPQWKLISRNPPSKQDWVLLRRRNPE